jgi:hypothetical protein
MTSLLQTVAKLTKTVMPGDTEASVTLLVKGEPTTVVSTGRLALDLDETQYERDHGSCLHAARTAELTEITNTAPTAGGRTTCSGRPSTATSGPCPSRWPSPRSRSPAR